MTKFLHINVGRCRTAQNVAVATAAQNGTDILMLNEPNKSMVKGITWIKDRRTDVAIYIINRSVTVRKCDCGDGWIKLDLCDTSIVACYISPNIPIREYENSVDEIMDKTRGHGECIITGDINAKSPAWGAPAMDKKGEYWMDWIASARILVVNDGKIPTFVRGNSESFLDVTLATENIYKRISNWEVMTIDSATEHRYISFELKMHNPKKNKAIERHTTNVIDWDTLRASIDLRLQCVEDDQCYLETSKIISSAYKDSTSSNSGKPIKPTPYWWNTDIADKRDQCNAIRRVKTRLARRGTTNNEVWNRYNNEYKQRKSELQKLIRKAKRKHWKELCNKLDEDIWGDGYRIVVKDLKCYLPYELHIDTKRDIILDLFPHTNDVWAEYETDEEGPPITLEELEIAASKLKKGKAPGPDGIPAEVVVEIAKVWPGWLLGVFNRIMRTQSFPDEWKSAKVILIPKKGNAFRPICLLNAISKLLEVVIRERLNTEIERRGGLSTNQFGFRKGRSTIKALEEVITTVKNCKQRWCVLVALDVKNAFNTARHSIIMKELRVRNIPRYLINLVSSYLKHRSVTWGGGESRNVDAGVPQGSVLGPTLWNILYDGVLRVELTDNAKSVAFADDLAIIVPADSDRKLVVNTNENLEKINNWMISHKLRLAPEKTEAIILKGTTGREHIEFHLNGVGIPPQKNLKYLGVTLDQRCTFGRHIVNVTRKAEERIAMLSRILPNVNGPRSSKREVLCSVMHSILLYGAPIWENVIRFKKYRAMLIRTQRKMLLRVASAYKTTSNEALQIITGITPIDIMVEERVRMHRRNGQTLEEARLTAKDKSIETWQRRWSENLHKGQWTKKLIPVIKTWLECKHRQLDYFLTQALTGHGSFRTYTKKIGKDIDDACVYCQQVDTPQHTIFQCPRWEPERLAAYSNTNVQHLRPDNLISQMTTSKDRWEIIHNMIKKIMKQKEKEEIEMRRNTD